VCQTGQVTPPIVKKELEDEFHDALNQTGRVARVFGEIVPPSAMDSGRCGIAIYTSGIASYGAFRPPLFALSSRLVSPNRVVSRRRLFTDGLPASADALDRLFPASDPSWQTIFD
jgi:hypothetical protein